MAKSPKSTPWCQYRANKTHHIDFGCGLLEFDICLCKKNMGTRRVISKSCLPPPPQAEMERLLKIYHYDPNSENKGKDNFPYDPLPPYCRYFTPGKKPAKDTEEQQEWTDKPPPRKGGKRKAEDEDEFALV